MFDVWTLLIIAVVGLVAGMLGGLLGVGGSVIMIPALVMLFGQNEHQGFNQHLYQAAAMIVNVAVALPAAHRHWRAGAVRVEALKVMLPAALVFILVGVMVSNLAVFTPVLLGRVLAVFLLYVIGVNMYRLVRRGAAQREAEAEPRITKPRAGAVGGAMGFVAGLLGIGGGAVAVPMQQVLLRLPLRNCIANSAAIIAVSAGVGAVYKNATLAQHGLSWTHSLLIAALLAPTALIGAPLGARLTHTLPLRVVRIIFVCLMIVAAYKLASG